MSVSLTSVKRSKPNLSRKAAASGLDRLCYANSMGETEYAFPKEKKEPIRDAAHVRNAIARFNQVKDVTDSERDAAWKRIKTAAKKFGVEVNEEDWRELSHGGKR